MRLNERVFNYSYFRVEDGLTLDLKLVMQSKPINLFNQHRKKCVTRKQMKQHVSVLKCSKLSLMQEQGSLNISIWRKLAVSISIHSMTVSEAGSP